MLLSLWRQRHHQSQPISNNSIQESPELDDYPLLERHGVESTERSTTSQTEPISSRRNPEPQPDGQVTFGWSSLPKKPQIIIVLFIKFLEIAYRSSTRTYLFYQLKWFDPSLPDSALSAQAGMVHGLSAAVQIFSGIIVGRIADKASIGRKYMILIGLSGWMISSIGLAFSKSFTSVMIFQAAGGLLDGNAALIRTVLAEIAQEKEHRSHAFVLLSLFANMGGMIGPLIGGVLVDPVHSQSLMLESGFVRWLSEWPYALPGIICAAMCFVASILVYLGLDETHSGAYNRGDWGRRAGKAITRHLFSRHEKYEYHKLGDTTASDRVEDDMAVAEPGPTQLPIRSHFSGSHELQGLGIFLIPGVLLTLLSRFLFTFHDITYNTLSLIFFPTPRASPFVHHGAYFGGGLGLTAAQVGLAMSMSGFMIIPLSLVLYPSVSKRMGILRCYIVFLPMALVLYTVTPFLVFVPDRPLTLWFTLGALMFLKALSRTFTCPASSVILNDCVSDPRLLATINAVGSSITISASSIGPAVGGWGLSLGLKYNLVGAVWWGLAMVGLTQWLILRRLSNKIQANDCS